MTTTETNETPAQLTTPRDWLVIGYHSGAVLHSSETREGAQKWAQRYGPNCYIEHRPGFDEARKAAVRARWAQALGHRDR